MTAPSNPAYHKGVVFVTPQLYKFVRTLSQIIFTGNSHLTARLYIKAKLSSGQDKARGAALPS